MDDEAAYKYLDDHGYVVIANALDAEQVSIAQDHFWNFVELTSGGEVQRSNPQTWNQKAWPGNSENGLFETDGVGQSVFLWYVRSRPKVVRAFQHVWSLADPADLLMSFDGCCAFLPTSVDASQRTLGGWYHTDQNGGTTGSNRFCVQGFVALTDQDSKTGGLSVLPGSHHRHAELFKSWSDGRVQAMRDFCILARNEPMLGGGEAEGTIRPRLVHAKAGDLVLWDSRCVHCNVPAWHSLDEMPLDAGLAAAGLNPLHEEMMQQFKSVADAIWAWHNVFGNHRDTLESRLAECLHGWAEQLRLDLETARDSNTPQLLRLVAYVCALPRARASPKVLQSKRQAVLLGGTATHWPDRAELKSINPESPAIVDAFKLSPIALQLLGCQGTVEEHEKMLAQLRHEVARLEDLVAAE